jgi:threonine synthase
MRYFSTRDRRHEWPMTLDGALSAGLAPDGGLYVPEHLPQLRVRDFAATRGLPAIAERLLAPFFSGSLLRDRLGEICRAALDLPTPVVPLAGPGVHGPSAVLELFHGPTAAFKDYAARFLSACLAGLRQRDDPVRTVLVATSGDTGGAVAAAFHRRPGFRVVILYPEGRVSPRQAHQLGAFGDNVYCFRVAGSFDDCQRMVKALLADRAQATRFALTSANSISLGRLLPQMAYYAHAALSYLAEGQPPPTVIVPSGNLGNGLAALLARAIGLPLGEIVLATNANPTLSDWYASGRYQGRPSMATLANAMDVGDPSNFERLSWLYAGRDARAAGLRVERVDDECIRARVRAGEADYGQVWCPHTACAVEVMERLRRQGRSEPMLLVATAHPAKFDSVVEPLVGHTVAPPPALAELLARPSHSVALAAQPAALAAALARLE